MKSAITWLMVGSAFGLLAQSCGSEDNKKSIRTDTGGEGGLGEAGESAQAGRPGSSSAGEGGAAGTPADLQGGTSGSNSLAGAGGTPSDCPTGFADCDGDPSLCEQAVSSVDQCGACDTTCTNEHGSVTCEDLACKVTSCSTGYEDCNGNPNDGCETNLVGNDEHCGACGRDCSSVGASCTVDSCGDIPMQQGVTIGIGNGPWNDRAWAFSSDLGIVNMRNSDGVIQWFGLDGVSSKQIWDAGQSSNETLVIDGEDIYWAERGTPNLVRKKALSAASNALPTDVFKPDYLPVYLRSQGDYFYWISGDYGDPGYVYRRLRSADADEPGTRIVDVQQGSASNISGFAVTTDAIYWITGADLDADTLDNSVRTTPLEGGVPSSIPKVTGATDAQIKDFGNYTIVANLTAIGDTLYFARTIAASALNGVYRFKKGDAAPTKLVEAEDVSTFAVGGGFVYYGLLNQQGVWRSPIAGGLGQKVGPTYQTTIVGVDDKFAYVAVVNQPGYFYKIFQ